MRYGRKHLKKTWKALLKKDMGHSCGFWFSLDEQVITVWFGQASEPNSPSKDSRPDLGPVQLYQSKFSPNKNGLCKDSHQFEQINKKLLWQNLNGIIFFWLFKKLEQQFIITKVYGKTLMI